MIKAKKYFVDRATGILDSLGGAPAFPVLVALLFAPDLKNLISWMGGHDPLAVSMAQRLTWMTGIMLLTWSTYELTLRIYALVLNIFKR